MRNRICFIALDIANNRLHLVIPIIVMTTGFPGVFRELPLSLLFEARARRVLAIFTHGTSGLRVTSTRTKKEYILIF